MIQQQYTVNIYVHLYFLTFSRFWEAVQQLKALPQSEVQDKVTEIWLEFLAPDASCPINVDSRSYELTKKNKENPDRWSFDAAAVSYIYMALQYYLNLS